MSETPASPAPGRDGNPRSVPPWPDWMDDPAYLALQAAEDDPGDPNPGTNTSNRYQTGHRLTTPTRVLICFYAHHC
jgi:hypothetical protein